MPPRRVGLCFAAWRIRSTNWNTVISREIKDGWSEYFGLAVVKNKALFSVDGDGGHYQNIKSDEDMPVGEWAHLAGTYLQGQVFEVRDELYRFGPPVFSRDKVRVLLSLDPSKFPASTKKDQHPVAGNDYPVSWIRSFGQGRVFYCSLGHLPEVFANPRVLRHFLAGIQFATGDLKADATPLPRATRSR